MYTSKCMCATSFITITSGFLIHSLIHTYPHLYIGEIIQAMYYVPSTLGATASFPISSLTGSYLVYVSEVYIQTDPIEVWLQYGLTSTLH